MGIVLDLILTRQKSRLVIWPWPWPNLVGQRSRPGQMGVEVLSTTHSRRGIDAFRTSGHARFPTLQGAGFQDQIRRGRKVITGATLAVLRPILALWLGTQGIPEAFEYVPLWFGATAGSTHSTSGFATRVFIHRRRRAWRLIAWNVFAKAQWWRGGFPFRGVTVTDGKWSFMGVGLRVGFP